MSQEPAKTPDETKPLTEMEAHPDDLIVAPKGTSRTRFVMTFLLVLLILTTFTVSDSVFDVLGLKSSAGSQYMTWKSPNGEARKLSYSDFMQAKRAFAPFKGMIFSGEEREPSDDETAYFLVLDEVSAAAGVRVTANDLKDMVKRSWKSSDDYKATARVYRMSMTEFEAMLRRVMRVQRYRDLVSGPYMASDPMDIAKQWKGAHQEFAFDYAELTIASVTEEARALAPQGEELKTWYEALTQPERDRFKTKEAAAAEVVAFPFEGGVADALLAKYPRPADYDAEAEGRKYHEGFGIYRFFDASRASTGSPIKPYEEVKDQVLKEAPIYAALEDWRKDMVARASAGATIDFGAEALALSLPFRSQPEPLSSEQWLALELPWMTMRLAQPLVEDGSEGQFLPAVRVGEKAFLVARVAKREASRAPELAEIEAAVRDLWTTKKAKELAVSKLADVREKLGQPRDAADPASEKAYEVGADDFNSALKAAGYESKRRDFQERFARVKPGETMSPVDLFLRGQQAAYTSKEGSVLPPATNSDGSIAFLVRVAGVRDPDETKMTVTDMQNLQRQKQFNPLARMEFLASTFESRAYFQERYGLSLEAWKEEGQTAAN